jgi:hypothetical protein
VGPSGPAGLQFIGDYGPAFAAVIVAGSGAGRAGLGRPWPQLTHWQVAWWWYAAAFSGPLALFLISAAIAAALTGAAFPDLAEIGRWPELPGWSRAGTWLLLAATIGLGEEVG